MTTYGQTSSLYLQDELIAEADIAVSRHQDVFKSRSHFVNVAIVRLLRELNKQESEQNAKPNRTEEDTKKQDTEHTK